MRICVKLNLQKKLVPKVIVAGLIFNVEYEGLTMICFSCGRFGHKRVMIFGVFSAIPIFALFPIMSIWIKHYGYVTPFVWAMIVLQGLLVVLNSMSFGEHSLELGISV